MKRFYLLSVFLFASLLTTCNAEMRIVNGQYTGFWGGTTWAFDFNIKGTYTLKVEGQAGNILTGGKFITVRDLVILNQDSTYINAVDLDLLVKTKNGCLKDMEGHFYCKNESKRQEAKENGY